MAKLSVHGKELFRAFSLRNRALLAVMEDGTVLYKTPFTSGWKIKGRKKADVPMEVWRNLKHNWFYSLPEWARECKSVPSLETLMRQEERGLCSTPDGHDVEPDGASPAGVPSWLRIYGII